MEEEESRGAEEKNEEGIGSRAGRRRRKKDGMSDVILI